MRNVVAFNLAKVAPKDSEFFVGLSKEFTRQNVSLTLFTPQRQDAMKGFTKPFDWVIANIAKQYPLGSIEKKRCLTPEQSAIWRARVAALSLQKAEDSPDHMVDVLERFANHVLDTYQPTAILCWNTLCPHSGILADLARPMGIKVYLLERAFLDNTWFLEGGGLVGHSDLVDRTLDDLIGEEEQDLQLVGDTYLAAKPFANQLRYAQNTKSRFRAILSESRAAKRPVLGFLPPDDLSLGFRPVDTDDRRKHLPGYESSVDAAIALAEAAPHCDVIFKPHPSFREMKLPDNLRSNLFVVDHDYREVIAEADVVVSTGTGLVANAMTLGKPVLQMNRDQFLNKGITYEALTTEAIPAALAAALAKENLTERRRRFHVLIGYCLRHYLVSLPSADSAFRSPGHAVRDIVEENFGRALPAIPAAGPTATVSINRLEAFRTLRSDVGDNALLVDLDHTLLFANTTEVFLDMVRPRPVFLAVHWLLTWLVGWSSLGQRGIGKDQIFDPLRVFLCALFSPWSLLMFRLRAGRIVREGGNHRLIEALRAVDGQRVIVVTNGHPWLVKPIVRAMRLGKVRIVCGNVLPTASDIRRIGKLAACSRRIAGFRPGKCISISDSMDDIQMLTRTARGFLIDWKDPKTKADPFAHYFPFVLTTEGKYPRARVVRRHRFNEDFPVILFTFALFGLGYSGLVGAADLTMNGLLMLGFSILAKAVALFVLFVSFNAVYEIGYWDNDFIAAAKEAKPSVSPAMERFRNYPIRSGAWTWGIVCGILGVGILVASDVWTDGILQAGPLSLIGDWKLQVATGIVIWLLGLMVTRRVFDLHNTLPESARIYSFYLLHVIKLTIYALVLPLAVAGVILIIAQVYRHWLGYAVYRFQGRKDDVPRMQVRGFFFLVMTAMFAFAVPVASIIDLTWICGALFLIIGPQGFRLPRRIEAKVT